VEAAGVELFSVMTARNLLIVRGAKRHHCRFIVRLMYENPFASPPMKGPPQAEYPTVFGSHTSIEAFLSHARGNHTLHLANNGSPSGSPMNRKESIPASVNREVLWTPRTDAS
jgi:hypothetical protein